MDGASHGSGQVSPERFPFLSLPAEVRNKVYGLLYEFDEPLHIVSADVERGKSVLHRGVEVDDVDITLFLVSRKIYEEASSVLYKHNTFTFVRTHSVATDENEINHDFLTLVAVPWVRDLGSRAQLLRKFCIDLGVLCPTRCASARMSQGPLVYDVHHIRESEDSINIGPLLCALWKDDLAIAFTVRHSMDGAYDMWLSSKGYSRADLPDVTMLSCFIPAIFQDKSQVLRKYIRTIGIVRVYTRESSAKGFVEFPVAPEPLVLESLEYIFGEQSSTSHNWSLITMSVDRTLQLRHRPRYPLLGLPRRILDLIEEHAYRWTRRTIDLDDCARRLTALGPYCLSRQWREQFGDSVLYGAYYEFRLTSVVPTASFLGVKTLRSLLNTRFGESYSITNVREENFGSRIQSTISINFVLGEESTLRDPRFDIVPLIEATLSLSRFTKVFSTL
ncbi:hypothetical protein BKA63DRAFT_32375 [Paraphoma chrysanthemicola]|nr:hypothetical protein BKA63DRAFT_32375 [Paraphoma chrysanthemicola]